MTVYEVKPPPLVWYCPVCQRTVSCPNPTYWFPNTTCVHPEGVSQMLPMVAAGGEK